MLWEDQLPTAMVKYREEEAKVAITDYKRGDKVLLPGGRVGQITGFKTKQNVQVRMLDNGSFEWISIIAKVHRAN